MPRRLKSGPREYTLPASRYTQQISCVHPFPIHSWYSRGRGSRVLSWKDGGVPKFLSLLKDILKKEIERIWRGYLPCSLSASPILKLPDGRRTMIVGGSKCCPSLSDYARSNFIYLSPCPWLHPISRHEHRWPGCL